MRDSSGREGLKKACNANVEKEVVEFLKTFLISWHYLSPNDAWLLEAYCDVLFSVLYV